MTAWTASLRTGTPLEVEYQLRRHDGEYRWFLVRGEPVRDADGRAVRWFGTCTDIDEAKRIADQFRSVRMLFRSLVERSEDGLVLVGTDGTVRYANPAAARLIGFPVDDFTGTDMWGSADDHDRQLVWEWWTESVLTRPGERLSVTVRFVQRSGPPRWLEVLATNLLPDPDVRAVAVQLRAVDAA